MSIFDRESGMSPLPWLQEKTLAALESAAQLVDLANEPDTTNWYEKKLKTHAQHLIARLAPVVALLHDAGQEAANHDSWSPIVEAGSLALTRWCRAHDIESEAAALNALAQERDDDAVAKGDSPDEVVENAETDWTRTDWQRLNIYGQQMTRLLNNEIPDAARRLLLWLLHDLYLSPWTDTVVVSRQFLPGDIRAGREQTTEAYRYLYENNFVERVEDLTTPERLALRVVVPGTNDSKHAPEYHDEEFGFEGETVGGKRTIGNVILLQIPGALAEVIRSWRISGQELTELKNVLQRALGEDEAHIQRVGLNDFDEGTQVFVQLRMPFESDDQELRGVLMEAAHEWLRNRVAGRGPL